MKRIFFLGITLIALASCYNPSSNESFEDLKKLEGRWSSKEGVLFNEHWQVANDSLMTGLGFSLKGEDTAFVEKMKVYLNGDSVYFAAKVDQKKDFVIFTLTEAGRNKWVFVNAAHDYPNIIQYEIKDDTLLYAFTA
ncbi:MAG TPA: DUF6265 family protein, partial [Bacteroidales bacterium]